MPEKNRRSNKFIFWSVLVLLSCLIFSCAEEDCFSVFNNDLLVAFNKADTLEDGQVIVEPLDTVFYLVKALGNDSIYYDSTDVSSNFVLPVNPAMDATTFEFQMMDSITVVRDTIDGQPVTNTIYHRNPDPHYLTVSYERRQRIISVDCGVEIGYVKMQVDDTTFPTTNLIADRLLRFNEVNVEVYF